MSKFCGMRYGQWETKNITTDLPGQGQKPFVGPNCEKKIVKKSSNLAILTKFGEGEALDVCYQVRRAAQKPFFRAW